MLDYDSKSAAFLITRCVSIVSVKTVTIDL